MKKERLIVELLDVVQLATPNFDSIDEFQTAAKIRSYRLRGSKNPPSYDMALAQMPNIVSGLMKKPDLLRHLDGHANERWRGYLKDVGERLYDMFSRDGCTWYPVGRRPIETFSGVWTKPAIRGVRVVKGGDAFPCLVNPRSSLFFGPSALSFVSRGVYEFHVIDNPKAVGSMIVDLGKHPIANVRANRVYMPDQVKMMPLEQFEEILRRFLKAVELAGMISYPAERHRGIDLFRPRK